MTKGCRQPKKSLILQKMLIYGKKPVVGKKFPTPKWIFRKKCPQVAFYDNNSIVYPGVRTPISFCLGFTQPLLHPQGSVGSPPWARRLIQPIFRVLRDGPQILEF
jgi:hypothetical protein